MNSCEFDDNKTINLLLLIDEVNDGVVFIWANLWQTRQIHAMYMIYDNGNWRLGVLAIDCVALPPNHSSFTR